MREREERQVLQIAEDEYRKITFRNKNSDTCNCNIKVLCKFGNCVEAM